MKYLCGWIGLIVGSFLGLLICDSVPLLGFICVIGGTPLGRFIGGLIEEEIENEKQRRRQEEYERERKAQRRAEAQSLARKYPEATKYYFKYHWGITKIFIRDYDITDERAEVLLGHRNSYEQEEQRQNEVYAFLIEAERKARRKAEQEAAERKRREEERKRREEERERIRKEAEIRNLINTLPACVSSWNSQDRKSVV